MIKKILLLGILASLASCESVDSFKKMQDHWSKMDMDDAVPVKSCDPGSFDTSVIAFCASNTPDFDTEVDSDDFDEEYQELLKFLTTKGFTVVDKDKDQNAAFVIAKPNKEKPNYKYIAIELEMNARQNETKYRITFGGNKKSAEDFFNAFQKTLG